MNEIGNMQLFSNGIKTKLKLSPMKKILLILFIIPVMLAAQENKRCIAPSPPMGWNSWNWHGKQAINEALILETMDAIVETGLLDAGYEYVVIDGGWRANSLGENGELQAHPEKFPNGMKYLADYAHSKGLKFGLHTVPGTHDCGGDAVGGLGREEVHIQQFVEWGLDFVKVDKCKYALDENLDAPGGDIRWKAGWKDENNVETVYRKWGELLKNSGRDILFSISAYEYREWYPEVCDMARTTPDIRAKKHESGAVFDGGKGNELKTGGVYSVMEVTEMNNKSAALAGNCYWNDPDMLVVGEQGMTLNEQKAHFALWCIMSSPLILGNDPRNMTPEEKVLIMNAKAIAVNQDPSEQGRLIFEEGLSEIWGKKLSDGSMAILFLNRDKSQSKTISMEFKDFGLKKRMDVYDIYAKKELKEAKKMLSASIEPASGLFLILSEN